MVVAGDGGTERHDGSLSSPPMTRPFALLLACLSLVAFAGCGDDDEDPCPRRRRRPRRPPRRTPGGSRARLRARREPAPKDVEVEKSKDRLDPAKTYVATVTTNCGEFKIRLDSKRARRPAARSSTSSTRGSSTGSASTGSCPAS